MLIKILRNTVANKQCVRAGDVIEVPKDDGQYLIAIGAATGMIEVEPAVSGVVTLPADEAPPVTEAVGEIPPLDEPITPKKKRKKQGDQ